MRDELCPFCGAYSPRSCEIEEETGGTCPWEESQPDPDRLREDRDDPARNPFHPDNCGFDGPTGAE